MAELNGRTVAKAYVKLNNKRLNAIKALQHHEKKVKAITSATTAVEAFIRMTDIESCYETFKQAVCHMEESDDFDFNDFDPAIEDVTEIYITIMSVLEIHTQDSQSNSTLNSTINGQRTHEKHENILPHINIPTFDDNDLEETTFYDSLQSLFDVGPELSLVLGHMSPCEDTNDAYFLAHHGVTRESSSTTKQRTVFDFSPNNQLLNGPIIQLDLCSRQILLSPEDRKFQKILFPFSENERIQMYHLNTVTFGLKPSPFLAIACTFALADVEKDNYPVATGRICMWTQDGNAKNKTRRMSTSHRQTVQIAVFSPRRMFGIEQNN